MANPSKNEKMNIYLGSRGKDFKKMIITLLNRGKLKAKYIKQITDEEGMKEYANAFTAKSADKVNNYERFEQLGDLTANKFIVWYSYKRFPQLDCTDGVKIVARLRINYGAKTFFGKLGEELGFWPFISAAEDGTERNIYYRNRNKKDLLEDCVESFIGCTEYLLDKHFRPGVGYGIAYDILSSIFDDINISLDYNDLYDAKTRLKETFDTFKHLGTWTYEDEREVHKGSDYSFNRSKLYIVPLINNKKATKNYWRLIGEGVATKKSDSQQIAAEQGLSTLRKQKIYKEPPEDYKILCNV